MFVTLICYDHDLNLVLLRFRLFPTHQAPAQQNINSTLVPGLWSWIES